MAHFAKIGLDNKVIDIVVIDTRDNMNAAGVEDENIGIEFLKNLTGHQVWKQTSYNTHHGVHSGGKTPFRKNFGGIGMIYDSTLDAFIAPKPPGCNSYVLNEEKGVWEPPLPMPLIGKPMQWDEESLSWIPVPGLSEE
jgi:glyoxylase-like metal-dependent hydrolase (beta-lactamase superfamily II)